jgi:hypothetical protein
MKLYEMYDAPIAGLQDLNSDNSKPVYRSSRKTKLTLKQIRKLRRMIDVRRYEKKLYLGKVRKQYSAKSAEAAGAPTV